MREAPVWIGIQVVLALCFISDTILYFFRAYYHNGRLVWKQQDIVYNYVTGWVSVYVCINADLVCDVELTFLVYY